MMFFFYKYDDAYPIILGEAEEKMKAGSRISTEIDTDVTNGRYIIDYFYSDS